MIYYRDGKEAEYSYPFSSLYVSNHHAEGEIFRVMKQYDGVHMIFAFLKIGMIQIAVDPWVDLKFPAKRVLKIDNTLISRIRQHAGNIFDDVIEKTNRRKEISSAQEYIVDALAAGGKIIESRYGATLLQNGKRPKRVGERTLVILREKKLI